MILELCCDSLAGAKIAAKYGIQRIELCSALTVGGLTPSLGLIRQCASIQEVEVHVMIRHKEGNFIYSDEEIELMKLDIEAAKKSGAHGVVFGVLTEKNLIAIKNEELVSYAKNLNLEITFHRAFDFIADSKQAIQQLIKFGFDRVLTSGKKSTAILGIDTIAMLQKEFGKEIQIMAGSGVSVNNALNFTTAGIENLHFSAKKVDKDTMELGMGSNTVVDEEKIRSISNLFNS